MHNNVYRFVIKKIVLHLRQPEDRLLVWFTHCLEKAETTNDGL
jgi:hypothetical protein